MCRLHHKGCLAHKRGCKVRQDIYEQVGFKTRKTLSNTAEAKSGLHFMMGKSKPMCRLPHEGSKNQNTGCESSREHLRKSVVQLGETTVKTNVFRKFGPSNRPSGGVVGIHI